MIDFFSSLSFVFWHLRGERAKKTWREEKNEKKGRQPGREREKKELMIMTMKMMMMGEYSSNSSLPHSISNL